MGPTLRYALSLTQITSTYLNPKYPYPLTLQTPPVKGTQKRCCKIKYLAYNEIRSVRVLTKSLPILSDSYKVSNTARFLSPGFLFKTDSHFCKEKQNPIKFGYELRWLISLYIICLYGLDAGILLYSSLGSNPYKEAICLMMALKRLLSWSWYSSSFAL